MTADERPSDGEHAAIPATADFDVVLPAGEGWTHEIAPRADVFRIVDLEGNQAVDTLFFNARDLDERYSATDTIRAPGQPLPHDRHARSCRARGARC